MPPLIDITGKTYGRLKVIKKDESRQGRYTYWICECQCQDKTIVSVRGQHLKSGNTVSCGCVNNENIHKKQRNALQISGKKFGLLTAKYYFKSGKYGAIWYCECECGGSTNAYVHDLQRGTVKSCGCLEKLNQKIQSEKMRDLITHDTNIGLISKKEPNKNTTTGIRGVSWCVSKQKYIATITFQKKTYYLCSSSDLETCRIARAVAEEKIFDNFLEWYEKEYKKE